MRNDYRFKETHSSSGGLGFIVVLMIVGLVAAFVAIEPKPVSLCALVFFGVPSLMLSVVYATLQLRRSAKHLFLVSLSGGALAFMFNGLFLPPLHEIAALTLGVVTSLLAALFALPKQTTLSYD